MAIMTTSGYTYEKYLVVYKAFGGHYFNIAKMDAHTGNEVVPLLLLSPREFHDSLDNIAALEATMLLAVDEDQLEETGYDLENEKAGILLEQFEFIQETSRLLNGNNEHQTAY